MGKGSRDRTDNKKKADEGHYRIYGNTCIKCRERKAAKNKLWCSKCEEE